MHICHYITQLLKVWWIGHNVPLFLTLWRVSISEYLTISPHQKNYPVNLCYHICPVIAQYTSLWQWLTRVWGSEGKYSPHSTCSSDGSRSISRIRYPRNWLLLPPLLQRQVSDYCDLCSCWHSPLIFSLRVIWGMIRSVSECIASKIVSHFT